MQTALCTSEIEGETLNAGSVRSSLVRELGLQRAVFVEGLKDALGIPQTEALVGLLLEATADAGHALSIEILCQWRAQHTLCHQLPWKLQTPMSTQDIVAKHTAQKLVRA